MKKALKVRALVAEEIDKIISGRRKLGLVKTNAQRAAESFGQTAPNRHQGAARFHVPRHYK